MAEDLKDILKSNEYPGRGIAIGVTPDGENIAIAYFTMGRSTNSRNRIFIEDGDGIMNQAHDPALMTDPSLVIYAPVRVLGNLVVVTNGDQTDTIYEYLKDGKSFEEALNTRTFEPDPPNYTPRISGLINLSNVSYKLSILKSAEGNPDGVCRYFFNCDKPIAGIGHFIHTYQCDGNPIPSYKGEPHQISINNDFNTFSIEIWKSLNQNNKVSLFTRFINIKTGKSASKIFNKNLGA